VLYPPPLLSVGFDIEVGGWAEEGKDADEILPFTQSEILRSAKESSLYAEGIIAALCATKFSKK
jgi:hypothetical protein